MSPQVRAEVDRMVSRRTASDKQLSAAPIQSLSQSTRAEELGILQGQKLMLIDLNRCTRCGDCVQACVATHDDGHTRLFLDGPRFGDYLIPSSCRNCRDPVCMIGCPVGSIQQGENGQIVIRDWCIGCGVCARQCPYDSIQMHDESLIPADAPGWRWTRAVACLRANGCRQATPRVVGAQARHRFATTLRMPWNWAPPRPATTTSAISFQIDAARLVGDHTWRLLATTKGKSLRSTLMASR